MCDAPISRYGLGEDAEVPDDREAREDEDDRLQHREGDVPEYAQRPRPVDLGGLDQLARHLRKARVDRDDDEGQRAPDDQERDHRQLRERRRVPVVLEEVADVELRQHVVHDAVVEVRHPVEDLHRDDDGHRPGQHERRGEEHAHERADLHEQQREERPDDDRERDVRRGEHDRPQQGPPEDLVAEDRRVVVEADPRALALDELRQARSAGARAWRACRGDSRGSPR